MTAFRVDDHFLELGAAFRPSPDQPRRDVLAGACGGDDPFSDAEWKHIDDLAPPTNELVRVAQQDQHTRRIAVALLALNPDQRQEFETAGLMASGQRRTKAEMARFRVTLYRILQGDHPMTVRQVYYQMVARGLEKTEAQYKRVQQELAKMRRGERLPEVPYGWISDSTRWMRRPTVHESLGDVLRSAADTYRRDIWQHQPSYVEVWLEKDALAGVLYDVTAEWGVPLMVSRGYSSVSFLYEAAETIKRQDTAAHLYLFTDRDRSGDDIAASIEASLTDLAPDSEIFCHRAAVTEEQVRELDLPTRPPKREGDPPAVELDAIPANELRRICRERIERHIDPDRLRRIRNVEAQERETLEKLAQEWAA